MNDVTENVKKEEQVETKIDDTKRNRVSNEQILEAITGIIGDIKAIKEKIGFDNKTVQGLPKKRNYNTDKSFFASRPQPMTAEEKADRDQVISEYNNRINEQNMRTKGASHV